MAEFAEKMAEMGGLAPIDSNSEQSRGKRKWCSDHRRSFGGR